MRKFSGETLRVAGSTRCTAVCQDGKFCDGQSLPDAPFPICLKHAAAVLRYLNDFMPDGGVVIDAVRELEPESPAEPIELPGDGVSVVYYVRIGDNIKVGFTTNMVQRFAHYPPDSELLAMEYGDRTLETERLRQFRASLRWRREWFEPTADLLDHIAQLQTAAQAA